MKKDTQTGISETWDVKLIVGFNRLPEHFTTSTYISVRHGFLDSAQPLDVRSAFPTLELSQPLSTAPVLDSGTSGAKSGETKAGHIWEYKGQEGKKLRLAKILDTMGMQPSRGERPMT